VVDPTALREEVKLDPDLQTVVIQDEDESRSRDVPSQHSFSVIAAYQQHYLVSLSSGASSFTISSGRLQTVSVKNHESSIQFTGLEIKHSGFWLQNDTEFEQLKSLVDCKKERLVRIMLVPEQEEEVKSYIMHTKVLGWLIHCHSFGVSQLKEYIGELIEL
jgi:hypothetical protein